MKTVSNRAFTLAEVLITLAVIGVIASMTVPGLIQDSQDKETVVGVKKAFSVFSNAHKMLKSQGRTDEFIGDDITDFNLFTSVLSLQKSCGLAASQGCLARGVMYKEKNGADWTMHDDNIAYAKGVLTDGMAFFIDGRQDECITDRGTGPLDSKVCGVLAVDINRDKGPNQLGRDLFYFYYTKDGIYPYGSVYDTMFTLFTYCEATNASGYSCTAKVLTEDAVNY